MRSFFAKLATIDEKDLTSRETKLLEYIKQNFNTIVDTNMKIEELAKEVQTGYSTIYSLLKKMNIKGYRDFSISLSNDADSANIMLAQNDESVMNGYINIIQQNYLIIQKKTLSESIELIQKSSRVFVVYWEGILKGAANELQRFLYSQEVNTTLLDSDWDTLNDHVDNTKGDDLFIFLTKYGTSKHLEKLITKIKSQNGKSIFISGRIPSASISLSSNLVHTLIIEERKEKQETQISKSLAFHYFNDLLAYHYIEGSNKSK